MTTSEWTVREVQFSDYAAVSDVVTGNGLATEWPMDCWVGLWQENPAMPQNQPMPIGWVLEHAGKIGGYLGNIPMHYHFQGKRLLAAAAHKLAVNVDYRSKTLRLVAAHFAQKNVDLFLNTSANAASASVFQMCKSEPIPQPDYDKALFWVVNTRGLVESVLRNRGYGSVFAAAGGAALTPALKIEGLLRRRGPLASSATLETNVLEPHGIGDEFDEFWQRTLTQRQQCLLADRSLRALRWHFGNLGAGARQAKFVCAWRSSKLVGYAVLIREDSRGSGLRRSHIADLIAENDDPRVIDTLLNAAFRQAHAEGCHILELIGFPTRIRDRLAAGHAYTRQLQSWMFWYKAAPSLRERCQDENVWYGSLYDGDASL